MTASVLVCEYIKHGMTCELGTKGIAIVFILFATVVIWGVLNLAARDRR